MNKCDVYIQWFYGFLKIYKLHSSARNQKYWSQGKTQKNWSARQCLQCSDDECKRQSWAQATYECKAVQCSVPPEHHLKDHAVHANRGQKRKEGNGGKLEVGETWKKKCTAITQRGLFFFLFLYHTLKVKTSLKTLSLLLLSVFALHLA